MPTFFYLAANRTAGYSGFVVVNNADFHPNSCNVWMIPGTFFDDWDNQ